MDSRIYRSTNLGLTWELVCTTTLGIWEIVIDDLNNIYASCWTKRLISTDNGNSWTTISGPQVQHMYLDKYHHFYSGEEGRRSLDNCLTWTYNGPNSSVHAYAFVDSLIFAGTSYGVFLHDPSYEPYIGNNFFPLSVEANGNFIMHVCSPD